MSRNSRKTLTLLAVPALIVGSAAAFAQTAAPQNPTVAFERQAPELAGEGRLVPAQFFGREGRRGGRRGGHGGLTRAMFAEADANDDGSLTQAEVDDYLAAQLTRADTDGDGAVALEEFQTIFNERMRPRMVDAFQRLDDDGDGQIAPEELSGRFGDIVQRLDRNGDDALSPDDRRRRGEGRRGRGEGRDRGDRG